jgi:hypothetical protein
VVFLSFNSLHPEKTEFSADLGQSSVLPDAAQLLIANKPFDLIFKSGKAWLKNIKQEPEVLEHFKTNITFSIQLKYTHDTRVTHIPQIVFRRRFKTSDVTAV